MNPVTLIGIGWSVLVVAFVLLWVLQRRTGDAGVVDVGWTAALGFLAVLYAAGLDDGLTARRWLVAVLAGGWSGRLALYLLRDRVLKGDEDGRYRTLRARWGERAQLRFFIFFQTQALVAALLSVHFLLAMLHPADELRLWDALGVLVWIVSIGGEALADRQLERFRADPSNRGKTCREGLWRYSRHPNYFFEWLHWLVYVVVAVGAPWWPATAIAPAFMLFLILRVTGIPPTEEQALKSRGDDYRRYQRTTSPFFPWFPRSEEG